MSYLKLAPKASEIRTQAIIEILDSENFILVEMFNVQPNQDQSKLSTAPSFSLSQSLK